MTGADDVTDAIDCADFLDGGGVGYDEAGGGGGDLLADFGGGEERIGSGGDGATVGDGEEREDEFRRVGEKEHDDMAAADAKAVQGGGEAAGGKEDVRVGEDRGGGGIYEARVVGGVDGRDVLEQVGMEREVVRDGDVGESGTEDDVAGVGAHGYTLNLTS